MCCSVLFVFLVFRFCFLCLVFSGGCVCRFLLCGSLCVLSSRVLVSLSSLAVSSALCLAVFLLLFPSVCAFFVRSSLGSVFAPPFLPPLLVPFLPCLLFRSSLLRLVLFCFFGFVPLSTPFFKKTECDRNQTHSVFLYHFKII